MSLTTHSAPVSRLHSNPRTVREVLPRLTTAEKASLLAGVDDWHLRGIPRLGIPSIRVTDCGHGVTLCGDRSSPATCFPTGIGMASTWNEALLEKAGHMIGRETRALGCSVMLGPKLNLHRHPLNGRSFETFSEDPWLAGLLGAAVIRGIQAAGVGACVKAMAANNQQKNQEAVSAEVEERTLRELYLRGFELAIALGQPCAIMTAYNRLNGDYCSESEWLIQHIIKQEWKFPGFIVSDWRAIHTAKVYRSGLDLEMPGPGKFLNTAEVLNALKEGVLSEKELNDKAGRILRTILTYGSPGSTAETAAWLDSKESRETALAVAEESMILLKNEGNLLPLNQKELRKILVLGPNASEARLGGGGSASVTPFYSISPLAGIRELCGPEVEVRFMEGCGLVGTMETIRDYFTHDNGADGKKAGLKAEFFNSTHPGGVPVAAWSVPQIDFSWGWASPGPGVQRHIFSVRFSGWLTPPKSGKYRLGIYAQEGCVDFRINHEIAAKAWDSGNDNFEANYKTHYFTIEREFEKGVPVFFEISYGKRAARAGLRLEWEVPGTVSPVDKAITAARSADAVVICGGLSNLFEGGSLDRESMDLPPAQQQMIEQIAQVNPRTIVVLFNGGPIAVPWAQHVPALLEAWYPGQEGGRALARILFGLTNPSGRLPDTLPKRLEDHASISFYPGDRQKVTYAEGWAVGYRHFDAEKIAPQFPFGFGLSYTSFNIGIPEASTLEMPPDGHVSIKVSVQNTGNRGGKEVVQLYVRPIAPPLPRPVLELRAFRKVELTPGEKTEVRFLIGPRELQYFDPKTHAWQVACGDYEILAGPHSRSLKGVKISVR
jgi:beta-glucosidase